MSSAYLSRLSCFIYFEEKCLGCAAQFPLQHLCSPPDLISHFRFQVFFFSTCVAQFIRRASSIPPRVPTESSTAKGDFEICKIATPKTCALAKFAQQSDLRLQNNCYLTRQAFFLCSEVGVYALCPEMSSATHKVHVLHASATGTAEDIAENLAEELLRYRIVVNDCAALDDYSIAQLPEHACSDHIFIFVIATCGDGQVPLTMRKFWRFIRRSDLASSVLAGMKFAMFGLGDRAYVKFNAAARRLSTRLRDLGATSILPLVLGDDSAPGGYDKDLLPWIEDLLRFITQTSSLRFERANRLTEPRVVVEFEQKTSTDYTASTEDKWLPDQVAACTRETEQLPFDARVTANVKLTNSLHLSDDKEVRHIELDVSGASEESGLLKYNPGDIVHVMPRNIVSVVNAFFQITDLEPFSIVRVRSKKCKTRFGRYPMNIITPCTLRDFVSAQLDLTASPRRKFFERLAPFATDSTERDKLLEFASVEGAEALTQYAYREKRTILMTLRDFPSARPPLHHLLDIIPVLKSRPFSIASSSIGHAGKIHICASIVRFTTPLRFFRVGVCSSFFLRLLVGDVVPIYLEKGTSLRFDSAKPAVLIGPGTGVAPMRSFVFSVGPSDMQRWLLFGSRCKEGDFLYEEEWNEALKSKRLTMLTTAFSRPKDAKSFYVQNKMEEEAVMLWELLVLQNANIYVAGSAGSMPKGIRETLKTIACKVGKQSPSESEAFVRRLETSGRLQMECW